MKYLYETLEKASTHLLNETNRLSSLVNDLLSLSRMDSDREELFMEKVNLSEILKDTIDKLAIKSKKYEVTIYSDIPADVYIIADRKKIIQVFVNLIDNAIKYSPPNGKITINLQRKKIAAYIAIEDEGIGIPGDDLDRVFERFYRSKNAKYITGTGLGLSLSRELIIRHKGSIQLMNKKPFGLRVLTILPLEPDDLSAKM